MPLREDDAEVIPLFKVRMSDKAAVGVVATLDSGYIGEGPRCEEFERLFGDTAVLTNSCTSAITLALDLLGVGPGDEVISTPMTCLATNEPILKMGAKVVWADVDPNTGNIDADDVKRQVNEKTKAVVAVEWGGRETCGDLVSACGDVPLIVDRAHCVPRHHERVARVGYRGFLCYSFQAIKFLTCGDGGLLVCNLEDDAAKARRMRWFGLDRTQGASMRCEQVVEESGWKFQSNDVAASIGLANVDDLLESAVKHRANAEFYSVELKGLQSVSVPWGHDSDYWIYTVLVDDPAAFIEWMGTAGVECSQVHARNDAQPIFAESRTRLPGVDMFSARQVSIPVGWWLTEDDRARVVSLVREWDEIRSNSPI